MASTTLQKVAVNLRLNNGTTTTGAVRYANVSIGKLSTANYNLDKAVAVAPS